jgi:hypothetical protein
MTTTWAIEKDGYFFRAVNGSYRSSRFTSASQAGLFIQKKAGKEAHAAAAASIIGGN